VTAPPLPFVPESLYFQPAVAVILCWAGDLDEGREVIQPWLDLEPPIQMVDAMPYTVMQTIQDDLAPPGRQSYWKSGYLAELTDDAIAAAVDVAAQVPSPFSLSEIVLWGGAVGRVGADETAFGQRDGRFLFNTVSMWEDPAANTENIAWARAFHDAMQPYATEGVYVNFLSEEGDARVVEAYGAEKYARLAKLKAQYDPDNLFSLNQNIAPAS
jgi:FAD/FMN-containing dehydrogenase